MERCSVINLGCFIGGPWRITIKDTCKAAFVRWSTTLGQQNRITSVGPYRMMFLIVFQRFRKVIMARSRFDAFSFETNFERVFKKHLVPIIYENPHDIDALGFSYDSIAQESTLITLEQEAKRNPRKEIIRKCLNAIIA